jgi:hypothetical protein
MVSRYTRFRVLLADNRPPPRRSGQVALKKTALGHFLNSLFNVSRISGAVRWMRWFEISFKMFPCTVFFT